MLRIFTYITFIFVIFGSTHDPLANESVLSGTLLSPEGELRGVLN